MAIADDDDDDRRKVISSSFCTRVTRYRVMQTRDVRWWRCTERCRRRRQYPLTFFPTAKTCVVHGSPFPPRGTKFLWIFRRACATPRNRQPPGWLKSPRRRENLFARRNGEIKAATKSFYDRPPAPRCFRHSPRSRFVFELVANKNSRSARLFFFLACLGAKGYRYNAMIRSFSLVSVCVCACVRAHEISQHEPYQPLVAYRDVK